MTCNTPPLRSECHGVGFVKGGVGVTDKIDKAYEKMAKLGGATRRRNV